MVTILYVLLAIFAICFILEVLSIFFLLEKLAMRSIVALYITGVLIIAVTIILCFLP